MKTDLKFGGEVRKQRTLRDLSQIELGERVGCGQSAVSRLEMGQLDAVSEELALAICVELGIDPAIYRSNEVPHCCKNPDCPLNYLYLIRGQIVILPWMTMEPIDQERYCPACGSSLINRCLDPKCKSPLVRGRSFCMNCGHAYGEVPQSLRELADPKQYIENHNELRRQYLEVKS